ncbi:MAG: hypothetical protein AAGD01_03125 [Acidobacteriota bacterium]
MLTAAAILLVLLGLAHSVLGERYILMRLFRRPLPPLFGSDWFTRRTLRFAWHITSVAWWGFAALLVSDLETPETTLWIISGTFFVSGLISLIAGRGRHFSWAVFLAIAALVAFSAQALG